MEKDGEEEFLICGVRTLSVQFDGDFAAKQQEVNRQPSDNPKGTKESAEWRSKRVIS